MPDIDKAMGLSVLPTIRDWVLSQSSGVSVKTTTVTIAASDWSSNTCTKSVTGVTANNTVLVTYAPSSKADYTAADIYCSAQGAGTLTFGCTTTPTSSITVNVMIIDGGITILPYEINITKTQVTTGTWDGTTFTYTGQSEYYAGDTVIIQDTKSVYACYVRNDTTQELITKTVLKSGPISVYSFEMPDSSVTIST